MIIIIITIVIVVVVIVVVILTLRWLSGIVAVPHVVLVVQVEAQYLLPLILSVKKEPPLQSLWIN